MLSGENGILRQAAEAKTETEKASDIEMLRIASMSALTDGNGIIDTTDTTGTKKGSLKKALEENGIPTTNYKGDGLIVYNNITYVISENGDVGTKKFTAANYGDLVKYNVDIDGNATNADWVLFYDDGKNVYLIAKGCIGMGAGFNPSQQVDKNANEQCVEYLLKKENWINYKNENAEYAVGAPTLELFTKSYNEKYPNGTNGIIDYVKDTYGYKIGWKKDQETTSYGFSLEGLDETGKRNNLYYFDGIDGDMINGMYAYWLAAASAQGEESLMYVFNDGKIYSDSYHLNGNTGCAERPIICLKSDTQFEKVGDVWEIK